MATMTEAKCFCSDLQGVLCGVCRAGNLNLWATSRSGRARIRVYFRKTGEYAVYALDGHELLPRSKSFKTADAAKAYGNSLWTTL